MRERQYRENHDWAKVVVEVVKGKVDDKTKKQLFTDENLDKFWAGLVMLKSGVEATLRAQKESQLELRANLAAKGDGGFEWVQKNAELSESRINTIKFLSYIEETMAEVKVHIKERNNRLSMTDDELLDHIIAHKEKTNTPEDADENLWNAAGID